MKKLIDQDDALVSATLRHSQAKHELMSQQDGNNLSLNFLALYGGLDALAHFFDLGEHLAESSNKRVSLNGAKALDPRHLVEPRKRFIPR